MSNRYDLQAVRELLGAAFSAGEINTLAIDLFQPVYQDFSPGMTRAQKNAAILQHADKHGRIPDLLAYTKKANDYQYGRFSHFASVKASVRKRPFVSVNPSA